MSDTVNKEWYVIHTYSGYENKVKDILESLFQKKKRLLLLQQERKKK